MTLNRNVGGTLIPDALQALSGNPERNRMRHFERLTQHEREQAIKRMADMGMSDHGIAAAARISVEQVRQIIGQREEPPHGA
jgi:DNA-binding NarL/FixJ family response regulator